MLDKTFNSYQEWHTEDKCTWGDGDWQNEPDQVKWVSRGLDCLIVRNQQGSFCAYIAVPANHSLYRKHYSDVVLYAHGGVNFSGMSYEEDLLSHIDAGVVGSSNKDLWWFGFNCGHSCDYQPGLLSTSPKASGREGLDRLGFSMEAYRNIYYVMHELETLADQLVSAA